MSGQNLEQIESKILLLLVMCFTSKVDVSNLKNGRKVKQFHINKSRLFCCVLTKIGLILPKAKTFINREI